MSQFKKITDFIFQWSGKKGELETTPADKTLADKALADKATPHLKEVCVFPLPNVVLFPGTVLPLHIFEDRYKMMTDELLRRKMPLAMSFSKASPNGEMNLSPICGAGKVNIMESFPDGRKNIFVEGMQRLRLVKYLQQTPFIRALAETVPDIPFLTEADEKNYQKELITLVRRWIFLSPQLDDAYLKYVDFFPRPHFLADFIAFYFLPSTDEKQQFLEMTNQKKRVEKIVDFVGKNIKVLENNKNRYIIDIATSSN